MGVLTTAFLCLLSPLYYNPKTGDAESVAYVYFHYTREALLQDIYLSSYGAFSAALGGWLTLFAPVTASFAAVTVTADERCSGAWRLILHRTGKFRYALGRCIFFMLSGGITIALGCGIFGIITAEAFPSPLEYPNENTENFLSSFFGEGSALNRIYSFGGLFAAAAAQILEFFIYGVCCVTAPMIISAFCENKYIIICIPFFLKYMLNRICAALLAASINSGNERLAGIANIIDPDGIAMAFSYNENAAEIIFLNFSLIFFSMILFFIIQNAGENNA